MAEVVTLAVIGVGNRGRDVYARWALAHPDEARVVAVADPDPERRGSMAERHGIGPSGRFESWEDLLSGPGRADAVVIATPDRMHVAPALRALELGYDILLEKPIAPTREETLALSLSRRPAAAASPSLTCCATPRFSPP